MLSPEYLQSFDATSNIILILLLVISVRHQIALLFVPAKHSIN